MDSGFRVYVEPTGVVDEQPEVWETGKNHWGDTRLSHSEPWHDISINRDRDQERKNVLGEDYEVNFGKIPMRI